MRNLSRIEICFPSLYERHDKEAFSGLAKVLQASPNLKHLKLQLYHEVLRYSKLVDLSELFNVTTLSNLHTLDLDDIVCHQSNIRPFLATMHNLKKLCFVQRLEIYDTDEFDELDELTDFDCWSEEYWSYKLNKNMENNEVILPSLQDVEVTGLLNLKQIVIGRSPTILRNVTINVSNTKASISKISDGLDFLRCCTSVEELHLNIQGPENPDDRLAEIVAILNSIPSSTKNFLYL